MNANMAGWDRILRLMVAVVLIVIGLLKGGIWWVGVVIGGVFVLTSLIGYCPLYAAIGIKTRKG
ncbi:MAG: DUF2892 domain-containing protein [Nitrospirae bacterium]|nr:MAG: DUF2892 domain-containing protein [Nitrospirota bacterium]